MKGEENTNRLANLLRAEAEYLNALERQGGEERGELRGRVLELDKLEESLFVTEIISREESGTIRQILDPLCRRVYVRGPQ
jgi:predicted transposase YdaD